MDKESWRVMTVKAGVILLLNNLINLTRSSRPPRKRKNNKENNTRLLSVLVLEEGVCHDDFHTQTTALSVP